MTAPVLPSDIAPRDVLPPRTHNNPPPFDPDIYAAKVAKVEAFAEAGGQWLELGQITTEEQATYLADLIDGARKLAKEIEAWRVEAKRPHDEMGEAVQKAAEHPKDTIDRVIKKALDLLTPWQVQKKRAEEARAAAAREEARKRAEEAQRLAAAAMARYDIAGEVAAEQAAAEAKDMARAADRIEATGGQVQSASGGGRTIALVKVRSARIEKPLPVFMFFRDHPDVVDVLQRLANAHVRAKAWDGKDIPGTHTITEEKAR